MRTVKSRVDTVTAKLEGELDQAQASETRAQLDLAISDTRVRRLILDLSELTFMDSSGLGVLMGRYQKMARRGGGVFVKNVRPNVDKLFHMSGLYQIIEKL